MENRYKISRSAGQTQTAEKENNPDKRERKTEKESERDANANESNDEQEQQQFQGITKIKYGRIKCLCSALCALLRHLRPLLP